MWDQSGLQVVLDLNGLVVLQDDTTQMEVYMMCQHKRFVVLKDKQKNPLFQNIKFIYSDYKSLEIKDSLIYYDPPYQNTTQYKHNQFNHTEFYEWCVNMAKNNIVLVSEYNINHPNFQEIWNKEVG